MVKPRYSSNSGVFAKRGDPWITRREGVKDYGRDVDNEDPDYDFDRRFHSTANAIGKPKTVAPRLEYRDPPGIPVEADTQRRVANIRQKYRLKARSRVVDVKEPTPRTAPPDKPRERRLRDVELSTTQRTETVNGTIALTINRLHGHCEILLNGNHVASAKGYRDAVAAMHYIELQELGLEKFWKSARF